MRGLYYNHYYSCSRRLRYSFSKHLAFRNLESTVAYAIQLEVYGCASGKAGTPLAQTYRDDGCFGLIGRRLGGGHSLTALPALSF